MKFMLVTPEDFCGITCVILKGLLGPHIVFVRSPLHGQCRLMMRDTRSPPALSGSEKQARFGELLGMFSPERSCIRAITAGIRASKQTTFKSQLGVRASDKQKPLQPMLKGTPLVKPPGSSPR